MNDNTQHNVGTYGFLPTDPVNRILWRGMIRTAIVLSAMGLRPINLGPVGVTELLMVMSDLMPEHMDEICDPDRYQFATVKQLPDTDMPGSSVWPYGGVCIAAKFSGMIKFDMLNIDPIAASDDIEQQLRLLHSFTGLEVPDEMIGIALKIKAANQGATQETKNFVRESWATYYSGELRFLTPNQTNMKTVQV